jgi:membrane fusion protein (multidrug efflux system)
MMRGMKWGLGALGMSFAVAMIGCGAEEQEIEVLLPAVSIAEVVVIDLDEEIHASGELEARFHTMIAAEIAGRVTELSVDEGGSVEVGATVIEIDPERRKLDLGAAQARRAQARANYRKEQSQAERIRKLRSESISSVQALEEAETALLFARSALEAEQAAVGVSERALADASVSAPFAGLVARRSVDLGEFVQVGEPLFELVSLNPLEAIFSLTELDTERVRLGQPIGVRVGAFRDRTFQGKVTFVAPTVDPATRTLRIKAEVDNSEGLLRPGLFARVSLGVSRREDVMMVPEEAVIQRATGAYVFRIVDDDRVERVDVETGAIADGRVEVRGPISGGDWVVKRGHGGLANGMSVAVRDRQSSQLPTSEDVASGDHP